jgi:hypothetical protein
MEISWDDVNRTERTGPHFVTRLGIDVFVTEGAIARWKDDPECHHKVVAIATSRGNMYSLGPCEPRGVLHQDRSPASVEGSRTKGQGKVEKYSAEREPEKHWKPLISEAMMRLSGFMRLLS